MTSRGQGVFSRYLHAGTYTHTLDGYDGTLNAGDDVETITNFVGGEIEDAITNARTNLNALPGDLMGLVIRAVDENGYEFNIGVTLRPTDELTTERVLEAITNALNSNQTLDLNFTVVVTLLRSRDGDIANVNGNFRQTIKGDMRKFIYEKRGIVQINPTADQVNNQTDCFCQFIVMGLAYLVKKEEIAEIDALGITKLTYSKLVGHVNQFRTRNELSSRLKTLFDCSIQSFTLLNQIQERFDVHIVLFKSFPLGNVAFPSQSFHQHRPIFYGILSNEHEQDNQFSHVDLVNLPTSIFSKLGASNRVGIRFCNLCLEPYLAKRGCSSESCSTKSSESCVICHKCYFQCQVCCYTACEKVMDVSCRYCHLVCNSEECYTRHLECCVELFTKKCDLCGRKVHKGLPCGTMRCFFCSNAFKYEERLDHKCFLQKEKLKKWNDKWAVFDFECCLSNDSVHVPYLCTVWFPNGAPDELVFPHDIVSGEKVFVFWGLANEGEKTGVNLFYELLVHDACNDYVFFAHNSRSYDGVIVKHHMLKYKKMTSIDVKRGLKLLNIKFPEINVEIRDSLSFIPTRLQSMSSDFGIEEFAKGHFPHKIMTVDFLERMALQGFTTEKPPRDAFSADFNYGSSGTVQKRELDTWLDEFYSNDNPWNVKEDAIKYCISDTLLLGKSLAIFQSTFKDMTQTMVGEQGDFDCLSYVTLPSSMMSFYLSTLLPDETIGVIDSATFILRREAYHAFFSLKEELGDFEVIDDWTAQFQNCVVLYRDCYSHGCRRCFKQIYRNERLNIPFSTCFALSFKEEQEVCQRYPSVRILWKHDVKQFIAPEDELPLLPRDAYKGGKVEVYKHCFDGEIQMVDYVSQYPTTLLGTSQNPFDMEGNSTFEWKMPTGVATRKKELDLSREGIAKCCVLPPQNCWNPFLSYKVFTSLKSYEIIYGNCKSCMDSRLEECEHEEKDRVFFGTWTFPELRQAVKVGYKIIKVVDVLEYETSSCSIFRDFIVPFMIEKILSKKDGLVDDQGNFTEQGRLMKDYISFISGRQVIPEDFKNAPSRRTVAKLAMNSFTGKWGQSEIQTSSKTFTEKDQEECRQLVTNPNLILKSAEVVKIEDTILLNVEYEPRIQSTRSACRKNDIIVAYITAFGRIMLNNLENVIGKDNMIYEDTDSAFLGKISIPRFKCGFGFGDLELELKKGFNFVSGGKKWYSFEKENGTTVCKLKGFTIKQSTSAKFYCESLRKHVWSFKEFYQDKQKEIPQDFESKITVKQVLFKTEVVDKLLPRKRTIEMSKSTGFRHLNTKRRCIFTNDRNIDTVPYGYK